MHSGSHSYTPTNYYNQNTSNNQINNIKQSQNTSLPIQSSVEPDNISINSNNSINYQIRSRINSFKNTAFSTPKFLRRKLTSSDKQQSTDSSVQHTHVQSLATSPNQQPNTQQQQQQHSSSTATTPTNDSKSWFRWNFSNKDYGSTNSTNSTIQDKEYVHIINDRALSNIKADLIHAFLTV